ncbi:hypothetical protein PRK78_007252 [Emydomyces testavorans]|uniref:Uncharacterized protein n=1 Tax=Emydomyces testavorans TaxID=2070801 RepID=A0AAF0DNV0_9EURO|nr:hypothetical protein PRK78_007252 [Emydomyces testavorans]
MRPSYWTRAPSASSYVVKSQKRYASFRPFKAPSLRNRQQQPTLVSDHGSVLTPPLELFTSAIDSGASDIKWMEAIDIARKCISAAQRRPDRSVVDLTKDVHEGEHLPPCGLIDLRALSDSKEEKDLGKIFAVAAILNRSPRHQIVTEWALQKLARAGEPLSVVVLGSRMSKSSLRNDRSWILQKVEHLAREGTFWPAMVLYGSMLEENGDLQSAASWYRKAMEKTQPLAHKSFLQSSFISMSRSIPPPWKAYADVKVKLGEIDVVEEPARVGAFQYDCPLGFAFLLSVFFQKECGWDKVEEYLTKCAMSHNPQACYQLGELYRLWHLGLKKVEDDGFYGKFLSKEMLRKLISTPSRYHSPADYYNMAKEWFELASNQGHSLASVQMAVLLREENRPGEGVFYLSLAAKEPKYADIVSQLQKVWDKSDASITSIMRKCVQL